MASCKVRLAVLVAAAAVATPAFSQKPFRMPKIELNSGPREAIHESGMRENRTLNPLRRILEPNKLPDLKTKGALEDEADPSVSPPWAPTRPLDTPRGTLEPSKKPREDPFALWAYDRWAYQDTVSEIGSYFRESEPATLEDLSKGGATPGAKEIEDAINSKVAANVTEKARSDPDISFEVLTGNLTIKKPILRRDSSNVEITGGQVNLYKVGGSLAALVAACLHQNSDTQSPSSRKDRAAGEPVQEEVDAAGGRALKIRPLLGECIHGVFSAVGAVGAEIAKQMVRIPTKSPGYNGMMSPGIPE